MGIQLDIKSLSLTSSLDIKNDKGEIIGELRSACYSPHFDKVIGIAMMKKPFWDVSLDRKSTRLNSSHPSRSRMPSSA